MAGEAEVKDPKDNQEVITGPENPDDSLSADFGERPGIKLTGHPAMGEVDEPVLALGPEDDKEKVGPKPDEPKPEEFKPRFKSQEEAEKAHAEAERKMHEATTRAADLERERDELKKAPKPEPVAEKPAEEAPKPPTREEQKARLKSVALTANQKALEKIDQLDRTDSDYHKQVAEAWAEANTEALLEAGLGSGVSQDAINKMVADQVKETLKADKEATAAERAKEDAERKAASEKTVNEQAATLAREAGLDMDPDSVDSIVFWKVAEKLPDQDFMKGAQTPPLKDQVDWVIAEARKKLGKVAQTAAEREAAALKVQQDNAVLQKGGTPKPTKTKTEGPGSLGSDFMEVRRERTLS